MNMELVKETELEFRRDLESGLDHAEYYEAELNFLFQIIKQQEGMIEMYKEALNFYANEDIYTIEEDECVCEIFTDQGFKARSALDQ